MLKLLLLLLPKESEVSNRIDQREYVGHGVEWLSETYLKGETHTRDLAGITGSAILPMRAPLHHVDKFSTRHERAQELRKVVSISRRPFLTRM